MLAGLIRTSGRPGNLARLAWAAEGEADKRRQARNIEELRVALQALAKRSGAAAARTQLQALPEDSPGALPLRAIWAHVRGEHALARAMLGRLRAFWPDRPDLVALQVEIERAAGDWTALVRTLRGQPVDCLAKDRRRTLMLEALRAEQVLAFDQLFDHWVRGQVQNRARASYRRLELLTEGGRPLEAYGELLAFCSLDPRSAESVRQHYERKLLAAVPELRFQWYLKSARFPVLDEQEANRLRQQVRDLGSSLWQVRQKAYERLAAAGEKAGSALLEGSRSTDPEVRGRSLELLRRLFERAKH